MVEASEHERSHKQSRDLTAEDNNVYGLKWQEFHKKAFYKRPAWLEKVTPFTHTVRVPTSRNPYETDKGDAFDYHHLYLRKCQSLLCAADAYIQQNQADILLKMITDAAEHTPDSLVCSCCYNHNDGG